MTVGCIAVGIFAPAQNEVEKSTLRSLPTHKKNCYATGKRGKIARPKQVFMHPIDEQVGKELGLVAAVRAVNRTYLGSELSHNRSGPVGRTPSCDIPVSRLE